ncbi:MAG: hypothetical protein NTV62_02740 [Candidatus Gribaldobacteria bacterium]|nr:hypothetical protein [Candidatus Gribaldobacteria bacterium]
MKRDLRFGEAFNLLHNFFGLQPEAKPFYKKIPLMPSIKGWRKQNFPSGRRANVFG